MKTLVLTDREAEVVTRALICLEHELDTVPPYLAWGTPEEVGRVITKLNPPEPKT